MTELDATLGWRIVLRGTNVLKCLGYMSVRCLLGAGPALTPQISMACPVTGKQQSDVVKPTGRITAFHQLYHCLYCLHHVYSPNPLLNVEKDTIEEFQVSANEFASESPRLVIE
jgi:hypothetical protein